MRQIFFVILGITVQMFLGCALHRGESYNPSVKTEQMQQSDQSMKYNSVAILDRNLQKQAVYNERNAGAPPLESDKSVKIAVESSGARRSPTGTVEVWALLRNRTSENLYLEGRVQFFDKTQAPVEGPTAWQRLVLHKNAVIPFKEFSTNIMDIGYYYIEIKEGP